MEIPFDNADVSTASMACCTSTGMFAESYLNDRSESLMFCRWSDDGNRPGQNE
jgi:hypothetical protein